MYSTTQKLYQPVANFVWHMVPCLHQWLYRQKRPTNDTTTNSVSSKTACSRFQLICTYVLKLSPIFVLWTILKLSIISTSLTLFFVQNSAYWSKAPLLPIKSILSFIDNLIVHSYAFWVGVVIQWQVATLAFVVLPYVLYDTEAGMTAEFLNCSILHKMANCKC